MGESLSNNGRESSSSNNGQEWLDMSKEVGGFNKQPTSNHESYNNESQRKLSGSELVTAFLNGEKIDFGDDAVWNKFDDALLSGDFTIPSDREVDKLSDRAGENASSNTVISASKAHAGDFANLSDDETERLLDIAGENALADDGNQDFTRNVIEAHRTGIASAPPQASQEQTPPSQGSSASDKKMRFWPFFKNK